MARYCCAKMLVNIMFRLSVRIVCTSRAASFISKDLFKYLDSHRFSINSCRILCKMLEGCLKNTWGMLEGRLKDAWRTLERCLKDAWKMLEGFFKERLWRLVARPKTRKSAVMLEREGKRDKKEHDLGGRKRKRGRKKTRIWKSAVLTIWSLRALSILTWRY